MFVFPFLCDCDLISQPSSPCLPRHVWVLWRCDGLGPELCLAFFSRVVYSIEKRAERICSTRIDCELRPRPMLLGMFLGVFVFVGCVLREVCWCLGVVWCHSGVPHLLFFVFLLRFQVLVGIAVCAFVAVSCASEATSFLDFATGELLLEVV